MQQQNTPPALGALSINEFCRAFHIGRTTVYAEIKAGRLSARKLGSRTIILTPEAERWANDLPGQRQR
jgi:hypothetical protein